MTQILVSILLCFLGSRIGVMLCDFMSYKEIFGFFKEWVAEKVDKDIFADYIHDINDMGKLEAAIEMNVCYDLLSHRNGFYSFLLRLLDCKFCLTIWASLFVSIIAVVFYGFRIELIFLTPIIGYFITEKL